MSETQEYKMKLAKVKSDFELWKEKSSYSSSRLVHYCGVDTPNSLDILIEDVWGQIEGCLQEGFQVAWNTNDEKLYICVQEPGCPMPSWEKVYSEEAIDNVDEILRKAGFEPKLYHSAPMLLQSTSPAKALK